MDHPAGGFPVANPPLTRARKACNGAAMITLLPIATTVALAMAQYGGMDMAVAEKWAKAKVVKYRAEGVHKARAPVVFGDYEGKADVSDSLTVEFTWDVRKRKIVGPVTIVDGKTELANIKSDKTNCPPPQLSGAYEHFQSVSHTINNGQQIIIKGTRTYPPAKVSNYPASCSMRSIPGGKSDTMQTVVGMAPEGLGMPINPALPFAPSADRKSLIVPGSENWKWTYTPTLVE